MKSNIQYTFLYREKIGQIEYKNIHCNMKIDRLAKQWLQ